MITLFGKFAPRTSRNYWMLEELRIPYIVEPVDYSKGDTRDPAYLAINPAGKIPALRDGDIAMTESFAINLYLAERYGRGTLWPDDDPFALARTLQWTLWVATEFEPAAMVRVIQHMYREPKDRDQAHLDELAAKNAGLCAYLEQTLEKSPYLGGERFGVVDLNVSAAAELLQRTEFDFAPWPAICQWLDRCHGRPAHQKVGEWLWVK